MALLKRPRWLTTHPKARKDRPCDGVKRGQRYEKRVLPPRAEPNSGVHWRVDATCAECVVADGREMPRG